MNIKCNLQEIPIKYVVDGDQGSFIHKRYEDKFHSDEITDVLTISMNDQTELVVPFDSRLAYLKHVHQQ